MNLCLIGHDFKYELEKLIRIFLPFEKIDFFSEINLSDEYAITEINGDNAIATVCLNGKVIRHQEVINKDAEEIISEIETFYNQITTQINIFNTEVFNRTRDLLNEYCKN